MKSNHFIPRGLCLAIVLAVLTFTTTAEAAKRKQPTDVQIDIVMQRVASGLNTNPGYVRIPGFTFQRATYSWKSNTLRIRYVASKILATKQLRAQIARNGRNALARACREARQITRYGITISFDVIDRKGRSFGAFVIGRKTCG